MNILINRIKSTYKSDIIFIIVGAVSIGVGFGAGEFASLLYGFGGLVLFLGLLMLVITIKRNRMYDYILNNYKTNSKECLDLIEKEIEKIKKAIDVDQRKAGAHTREGRDSASDVIRKQIKLTKFEAVKEEIKKYN